MKNHKEVFTQYLQTAHREGGKIAHDWNDWLWQNNIARCEHCGLYGDFGSEINCFMGGYIHICNSSTCELIALANEIHWTATYRDDPAAGKVIRLTFDRDPDIYREFSNIRHDKKIVRATDRALHWLTHTGSLITNNHLNARES